MFIIRNRKVFFTIAAIAVASALSLALFSGLNLSIEFTGGSLMEIRYTGASPTAREVNAKTEEFLSEKSVAQKAGDNGFIIRMRELDLNEHQALLNLLSFGSEYTVTEERFTLIGPSIGEELRTKAWIAISAVLLAIILFVMFAFRKIGDTDEEFAGPPGWHYGFIAIIALMHDIAIPLGIFAFLGTIFLNAQIDTLFVTALLAILGYSVNDTIVVFDRVRENIRKNAEDRVREPLGELVGKSLRETYTRSINTSLTTLLVLLALVFLGNSAITYFALVLAIGVVAGTYSSIFLAAPLLLAFDKIGKKNK